mmetsp:Transcript_27408/g.56111  ORF Transcript_27408/g.56111 Transcript_27408/m.56111 type:complete len:208 (-) Transcript_27408:85-708(-)
MTRGVRAVNSLKDSKEITRFPCSSVPPSRPMSAKSTFKSNSSSMPFKRCGLTVLGAAALASSPAVIACQASTASSCRASFACSCSSYRLQSSTFLKSKCLGVCQCMLARWTCSSSPPSSASSHWILLPLAEAPLSPESSPSGTLHSLLQSPILISLFFTCRTQQPGSRNACLSARTLLLGNLRAGKNQRGGSLGNRNASSCLQKLRI